MSADLEPEQYWCWECANLGIIPDDDPGAIDPEPPCLCCENYDHDADAAQPPPCFYPPAKEVER